MTEPNTIKKTLVWTDNNNELVDTIEHEGSLWLVLGWCDQSTLGLTRPTRLVRMDPSVHKIWDQSHPKADFVLNGILPKSLFDHKTSPQQETHFHVLELPDLWFESQTEEKS